MDPTAQQNQPQVRPMNEPHTPITMDEMNPNIHNEPPKSAKGTLLTLASLLVLLGIVGITLFLYIQNQTSHSQLQNQSKEQIVITEPTPPPHCNNPKSFMSIEEALKDSDNVCMLDLTGQNLKNIPISVSRLKNLRTLILTGNQLNSIPSFVYDLPYLVRLDLPSNNIQHIEPGIRKLQFLQILNLTGNQISSIPPEIGTLKNLTNLYLTANKLNSLPEEIKSLKNLRELRLEDNNISDQERKKISSYISSRYIIFGSPLTPTPTPGSPKVIPQNKK